MRFYLNPIYILVYESLFYLFIGIISSSLNSNFNTQSFLTILANIFSLLGYLIYVEVIELRFCGLNEKTKRILELKYFTLHFSFNLPSQLKILVKIKMKKETIKPKQPIIKIILYGDIYLYSINTFDFTRANESKHEFNVKTKKKV